MSDNSGGAPKRRFHHKGTERTKKGEEWMGFDGGSGRPYGEPGTRNAKPETPNSELQRTANETEAGVGKGNTEYRSQNIEFGNPCREPEPTLTLTTEC